MILAIRTDKPEAELYLVEAGKTIGTYRWQAHRELADTLLTKIKEFMTLHQLDYSDIEGIVVFTGEGSFTGLRIGTSVANALAYSLNIRIAVGRGDKWIEDGLKKLAQAKAGDYVVPSYNAEPNITKPKIR